MIVLRNVVVMLYERDRVRGVVRRGPKDAGGKIKRRVRERERQVNNVEIAGNIEKGGLVLLKGLGGRRKRQKV